MSVTSESIQIVTAPDLRLVIALNAPKKIDARGLFWSQDGSKIWTQGLSRRIFEWDLAGLQGEMKKLGMEWRR